MAPPRSALNGILLLYLVAVFLSTRFGSTEKIYRALRETTQQHLSSRTLSRQIVVAHRPRLDMLGSFVRPTLGLLAIARRCGWKLEILPFAGSEEERQLQKHMELREKVQELGKGWGTGVQDVSYRTDFDPIALNNHAYDRMGIFPPVLAQNDTREWIDVDTIPTPGKELEEICSGEAIMAERCYIRIPREYTIVEDFITKHGGLDQFFPMDFRNMLREKFLAMNKAGLNGHDGEMYSVAVHVRRGDINHLPMRWIDQDVYYKVVRRICMAHENSHVRIFSSGLNRDGNFSVLENLAHYCSKVSFHIDELEWVSWAYMIAADTLVMSPSSFSTVPSFMSTGEVYIPNISCQPTMPTWKLFHSRTGELVDQKQLKCSKALVQVRSNGRHDQIKTVPLPKNLVGLWAP